MSFIDIGDNRRIDKKCGVEGHYVYIHRKATDGSVFYVGKGKGRRAWSSSSRNRWWKFINAKHGHFVQIVKSGLGEACALTLERLTIRLARPSNLANQTDGGGGITGWRHSDEAKSKIGAFNKGKKLTPKAYASLMECNKNRVITPEQLLKMSVAKKGIPRSPVPDHVRKKISLSHMGLKPSDAARAKMRASKIGKACGRDSPTYDHAVRRFIHETHGIFAGTRAELIAAYGLRHACISVLISGKQKMAQGWRLI